LAASGKQIKDALARSAVFINGATKTGDDNMQSAACFAQANAFFNRFYLVRVGKKKYHLFEVV
jgi:tyrosyl-tRNA synthetase